MKKKIGSLFLTAVLACCLTACGQGEGGPSAAGGTVTVTSAGSGAESSSSQSHTSDYRTRQETAAPSKEALKQGQSNSAKTAVVYFSATGTTAEVAKAIAQETGGDLFEIVPQEVYISEDLNYHDDQCRANKEMDDDEARPAISSDLSAVSDYDEVYLGYPIWWGTAPRIIQTVLESTDLSKAAVYTFCTSGGSGIEQSVRDLQELYPDVNLISGKRFTKASKDDVRTWIDSLQ